MKYNYIFIIILFFLLTPSKGQIQIPISETNIEDEKLKIYFENILKKNKNSSYATYGLASYYYSHQNYAMALKYSKKNLKIENKYDTICSVIYGVSLDRIGKANDALDFFKNNTEKYSSYLFYYEYAFLLYKFNKHDRAQEMLKKSIEMNPYFPYSHYLLGCSLFEANNNPECIKAFFFGLMTDEDSLRSVYTLSIIQQYINKKIDELNIPFFEKRSRLSNINSVLSDYTSPTTRKQFIENIDYKSFTKKVKPYLVVNEQTIKLYSIFFNNLDKQSLQEVLIMFCLKNINNNSIIQWFSENKDVLNKLAIFIENTELKIE